MPKITIKALMSELETLKRNYDISRDDVRKSLAAVKEAENQRNSVVEQFGDLKKRLHNAETEVARLTGYVARVREDDVVREELIAVGEPGGEQRMVPKRKPEYLGNREGGYSDCGVGVTGETFFESHRKQKPKHWIEY
jgi:hypothetical protein